MTILQYIESELGKIESRKAGIIAKAQTELDMLEGERHVLLKMFQVIAKPEVPSLPIDQALDQPVEALPPPTEHVASANGNHQHAHLQDG